MHILLARHAERQDYVAKKRGKNWCAESSEPWNPPLSHRGLSQAKILGQIIAKETTRLNIKPVTRIYSSPFHRCIQTAVCALQGMGRTSNIKVAIEPSLVEGLCESWYRSWAPKGTDGTWGGGQGCRRADVVSEEDLHPVSRLPCGDFIISTTHEIATKYPALSAFIDVHYTSPFYTNGRDTFNFNGIRWGEFENDSGTYTTPGYYKSNVQTRTQTRQMGTGLLGRVGLFFEHIAATCPDETVLFVSHGGPTGMTFRHSQNGIPPGLKVDDDGIASIGSGNGTAAGGWPEVRYASLFILEKPVDGAIWNPLIMADCSAVQVERLGSLLLGNRFEVKDTPCFGIIEAIL